MTLLGLLLIIQRLDLKYIKKTNEEEIFKHDVDEKNGYDSRAFCLPVCLWLRQYH